MTTLKEDCEGEFLADDYNRAMLKPSVTTSEIVADLNLETAVGQA